MNAESGGLGNSIYRSDVQGINHGNVQQIAFSPKRYRLSVAKQVLCAKGDGPGVWVDFKKVYVGYLADIGQDHSGLGRFERANIYENLSQEGVASLLKLKSLINLVLGNEPEAYQ